MLFRCYSDTPKCNVDYEEKVSYCLISKPAWQKCILLHDNETTMIKLLMWLLVIWIMWFMIKNYLVKETQKKAGKPGASQKKSPQKMVKCSHCSVHMPESEALQHDVYWFCSQSHMQAYLAAKQPGN